MRAVLGVALSLVATAVVAGPSQFDLLCAGSVKNLDQASTPWNERISVDLATNAYRIEAGTQMLQIDRVEPGQIVFRDRKFNDVVGDHEEFFAVSRTTGVVERREIVHGLQTNGNFYDGKCAMASFTPFPQTMF